jgi:type VI protein secretion system component VasF
VLGAVAIRRVQRIPAWAAALTMIFVFVAMMFLWSAFIR